MSESFPIAFGRYQLVERLAIGGMAELFKAHSSGEHGFQKSVVIKRLLPHLAADEHFNAMFIDEARITSRLAHPKIAQTLEFGKANGLLYMAIEYVDGLDMLSVLRECAHRRMKLPPGMAVYIAHEVLDALDFAHGQTDEGGRALGIVHRDISPSNIVIARRGDVKLIDFGIARATEREQSTRAGTLKGKYGYMSPEQVVGGAIDPRSDLFSVGIVLAEMAMGRRLFTAPNELDVLLMVRDVKLERLERYGKDLEPELADIIRQALRKNAEERLQSAAGFRDLLAEWLYGNRLRVSARELGELVDSLYEAAMTRRRAIATGPLGPAVEAEADVTPAPVAVPAGVGPAQPAAGEATGSGPPSILIDFAELGPTAPAEQAIPLPPPRPGARQRQPAVRMPAIHLDAVADTGKIVEVVEHGELGRPTDKMPVTERMVDERLFLSDVDFDDLISSQVKPLPDPAEPRPRRPTEQDLARAAAAEPPPLEEITERGDEEGDLADCSGLRLLSRLSSSRANGLLVVTVGGIRKEIYFTTGTPIFVSSNVASELFGEHLVAQRIISAGELAMALAMMPYYGGKLGDTLVGLGLMKPLDVFRYLSRQVREKLVDVCTWEKGTYAWYEGRKNPRGAFPLDLDPFEVLGAGARSLSYDQVIRWASSHRDHRLRSAKGGKVTPERFKLGAQARDVYNGLDGKRSLGELMGRYTDDHERIRFLQVLYLLVETDLARWES